MKKTKQPLSDEERSLFQNAMGDVRRHHHDRVDHRPKPPPPRPRMREADEILVLSELLEGEWEPWEIESGEELSYCRDGVTPQTMKKLRRGAYTIHDELDLHGMTVDNAREALDRFLAWASKQPSRCVRVIHGKGNRSGSGGPILKQKVAHWLRQRAVVLAYHSALPSDGGTGAVYVLLSRQR